MSMTYKEAAAYLQPVADSTPLVGYGSALAKAVEALREIEPLREALKRYQDAEQDGRLKMLPCKIGATVYRLGPNGIEEERVKRCEVEIVTDRHDFHERHIGKTVFLTREEAERALEGGENK